MWFKRKPSKEVLMIRELVVLNNRLIEHLLAMARLTFIKPETFFRESNNVHANADYLLRMLEHKRKEDHEAQGDNGQKSKA